MAEAWLTLTTPMTMAMAAETAVAAVGVQQSRCPCLPVCVHAPFSLSRSLAGVLGSEKATEEYGCGGNWSGPGAEESWSESEGGQSMRQPDRLGRRALGACDKAKSRAGHAGEQAEWVDK